ncbi:AraC family transcriptional regulator [Ligilactobacillus sp. WILCCON 0076]|uniref:AraC family transcriptional regulator n=1 Tax=Ligilactobacillus ubinensis TaxID=2876789 RepID=A0A9X2FH13_9LACO|nr:helix-turn-helix domain-containing protein [Ligilactobacillus ubinensis]MCP0885770.1 AraC family transcriptional regulator [Ligilactobacillus ubinensis]
MPTSFDKKIIKQNYESVLKINSIITTYYFEFSKNYHFPGERHDFWEMVYVDRGPIEVYVNGKKIILDTEEIIFHKPNEFHEIGSNGVQASNVLVVTFTTDSPIIHTLENVQIKATSQMQQIIRDYLNLVHTTFNHFGYLDVPSNYIQNIETYLKIDSIYTKLKELLLLILSTFFSSNKNKTNENLLNMRYSDEQVAAIIDFMLDSLEKKLSLDDFSEKFFLNKSKLQKIFKQTTGIGLMQYFKLLKIELSKRLVREGNLNFTQIADLLAFNSIHHFSYAFKQCTGMSPSEYSKSIENEENTLVENAINQLRGENYDH